MASDRSIPGVPWWLKTVVALTLINTWVLFEWLVVNPSGLDRHLPLYRVGHFCPWDASVIILVITAVSWGLRRPKSSEEPDAHR